MSSFVLTGAAEISGRKVVRRDLVVHIHQLGHYVEAKVNIATDYLVASRFDTKKANDARAMGVAVISYGQLDRIIRGDFLGDV